MELIVQLAHPIFKWLHIIAGITWTIVYFFNWINVLFILWIKIQNKVIPELCQNTFIFRMGRLDMGHGLILMCCVLAWLFQYESVGNLMFDAGVVVPLFLM